MGRILASELLKKHGKNLIGKTVLTEEMGGHPGGLAVVTKIRPDKGAPEIVFEVKNYSWGSSIGVFEYEHVILIGE